MKTLWTATAVMAFVTVLLFVLIKSPVPGIIGAVVTLAALAAQLANRKYDSSGHSVSRIVWLTSCSISEYN